MPDQAKRGKLSGPADVLLPGRTHLSQAHSKRDVRLERSMLRVQIKKILIDDIMKGKLKPGERVVETRIARELSVSQAPVREALLELEQLGLITMRPYQGAFVREPTQQDIKEAYSIRSLFEGEAASEACRLITPQGFMKLEEALNTMLTLAEQEDTQKYIVWDIKFHEIIMKIAGNRLMLKFWKQIRMADTTYITLNVSRRSIVEYAVSHKEIYSALKEKDCQYAGEAMRNHINDVMKEVLKNMRFSKP